MVFTDDGDEQSANERVVAAYTLADASCIFASLQRISKEGGDASLSRRRQLRKQVCAYTSIHSVRLSNLLKGEREGRSILLFKKYLKNVYVHTRICYRDNNFSR